MLIQEKQAQWLQLLIQYYKRGTDLLTKTNNYVSTTKILKPYITFLLLSKDWTDHGNVKDDSSLHNQISGVDPGFSQHDAVASYRHHKKKDVQARLTTQYRQTCCPLIRTVPLEGQQVKDSWGPVLAHALVVH